MTIIGITTAGQSTLQPPSLYLKRSNMKPYAQNAVLNVRAKRDGPSVRLGTAVNGRHLVA